jgi:uncharacterized protein YifN (PemK superfamily)
MPINFHPKPGMVLICDYSTGFVPPEMVKKRRVIVVSPYQRNKRGICTVIPLSTSTPEHLEDFHYRFPAGKYNFLSASDDSWVKADMLATVSFSRLDRVRVGHNFIAPSLNESDFQSVIDCIQKYLEFQ